MEPTQPNAGSKKYLAIFSVIAVVVIGNWYAFTKFVILRQQSAPTGFSPNTQSVPSGAASRDADQSLAAFGLSVAPPFFDKKNVVQSLQLGASPSPQAAGSQKTPSRISTTATSSAAQQLPTTFLSYRIIGRDRAAVRAAFADYFKNLGWKTVEISGSDQASIVFFTAHQSITITLIPGTDQQTIIAAMTMQSTNPR